MDSHEKIDYQTDLGVQSLEELESLRQQAAQEHSMRSGIGYDDYYDYPTEDNDEILASEA